MKWKKEQTFDCETYLQTLAMGIHSPVAEEHVANCNFCRDIYHGGSEEFPLSLKEAADAMRAEKKRKARRKFFMRSGLVAAGLAGGLLLGVSFPEKGESAKPSPVDSLIATDFSRLDALYGRSGRSAVESRLNQASTHQAKAILNWIQERGHASMYDLLCQALTDPRSQIRIWSLFYLRRIDRVALKPHVGLILQASGRTRNDVFRTKLEQLAEEVEAS